MKRSILVAAALACALVFALAGCAPAPAKSADKDSLVGFWILDESTPLGFTAVLNIDSEENLAELMMGDSYLEGTWTTDGTNATVTFDDSTEGKQAKAGTLYVQEGKLVLGQDNGSKLMFTKGDMETYFNELEGGSGEGGSEGAEVVDVEESDVETVDEVINDMDPVTIADDKTVTIKATGIGTDFTGDPGYRLEVTNNTKKPIYISSDDVFKVGGKDVEAGAGEVIEAGETVKTFLYFSKDDLGGSVEKLKDISGTLVVGDDASGDEIKSYEFKM